MAINSEETLSYY